MGRVYAIKNRLQYYKDKLKGQFRHRWISTFVLACFYAIRVYLHGYLAVTFVLGISLTSLTSLLLFSVIHPDHPDDLLVLSNAPPILPMKESDELRPFVPLLPEFNFWCIVNMLFCVALPMTFIPKLNYHIPGLGYIVFSAWLFLTLLLLFDLRYNMKKYKYFPFYYGDKK
ncbi:hypothetical protein CASFOL_020659 [Castilleja foliolosa]|uniref:Protein RER1 n=1 Tax=Castilleja foliolosa TaxID=1961234 RepID=A0ABD3D2Z7_9LAMI